MSDLGKTDSQHFLLSLVSSVFLLASDSAVSDELWRGADLSYVNEMEDCGATYRMDGETRDPYALFAQAGANVVRLRLWHSPDWTPYSTLADVKKSIRRARESGMRILLDFHYSDDWADPGDQIIPAAWRDTASTEELAERLHDYTFSVLTELNEEGLLPEFVQVGNETNTEILLDGKIAEDTPIDWERNVTLLNAGIAAVRRIATDSDRAPEVMLHIAQPEYVEPWLDAANRAGIADFDMLGVSYYPKWSTVPFSGIESEVRRFTNKYDKDVVIVETAYPWTLKSNDPASNILGEDSLEDGYPATTKGQRKFLIDLMQAAINGGGLGIVYWEPAWVSTNCETRWGKGSHWENATLFDYKNTELHKGADFLRHRYTQ